MRIYAETALLPGGWASDVAIDLAGHRIAAVHTGVVPGPADHRVPHLVPAMANLHSHAFQRGFSGLTEERGPGPDSFWSWREMMYRFALTLSPDGMQAIAEMAYVEMLEAGFARVGEFHYLHHDPDGRPYADPAEMSARIFAAAHATGIALTHLPVFYAHGGFGPAPATGGQRRFLHDRDAFLRLVAACDALVSRPLDRVGFAPHSLRAATVAEILALREALPGRRLHIHVAEQMREVEDCVAATGQRPVAHLDDRLGLGPDWCLIHATHLDPAEQAVIAASGAVVGLCPVTEANLGDGIFPARAVIGAGGRFGVGTDSNVAIGLAPELRVLECGQRLTTRERNVLALQPGSTGAQLFHAALSGGAQALDQPGCGIAVDAPADLVGLSDPIGLGADSLVDRWIFGTDIQVDSVWAGGRQVVRDGRHVDRDRIAAAYARAVRAVLQ